MKPYINNNAITGAKKYLGRSTQVHDNNIIIHNKHYPLSHNSTIVKINVSETGQITDTAYTYIKFVH